jgi:Amt family ammonium transporter
MLAGVQLPELFLIDEAVGAIPVLMIAGIWGALAFGFFGDLEILGPGVDREAQLHIQVMNVFVCGFLSLTCILRSSLAAQSHSLTCHS